MPISSNRHYRNIPIITKYYILLLTLLSASAILAQNDTIVLSNGDAIVGEMKSMDKNVLVMKTDYSDSDFKIEWDKVREIYSNRNFLFSFSYGMHLRGSIKTHPTNSNKIIITENGKDIEVNIIDVVFIKQIEGNFLGSFEASIDLGYNFTRDQNHHQFTSRTSLAYQTQVYRANASYNAVRNYQDDASDSKRTDANLGIRFFLKNDWFITMSSDFLQSDELKLKLRITTKPGYGKYILHTNKNHLTVSLGGAWNNEKYTNPADEIRNSLEAFVSTEYNLFDISDFSLFTSFSWYAGITEWGRMRFDFKVDLKYDLPLDFYIKLGYTQNFDNRPVEGASQNDYVIQTSFGWEF